MKYIDIIKTIELLLNNVDIKEEQIRQKIVTILLLNKNVLTDHVLFELFEKQKEMNNKQLELLKHIRRQLTKVNNKDINNLVIILKSINTITNNTYIESYNCENLFFLSKLTKIDKDMYFIVKRYIDLVMKKNTNIDTSSKESVIESLITEYKESEELFNKNYKKIKNRKVIL